jgi:glycerophosphoryl diester phosphodiesterase
MMEVISHRGYWKSPLEKNLPVAFERSFSLGFGTETDVRDHDGRLVISHDMPTGDVLSFETYLNCLASRATRPLLQAINIKADGLARALAQAMKDNPNPWFVFDMSLPDTLMQLKAGNPVYMRMSEYESIPAQLESRIRGVWLDAFEGQWFGIDTIKSLLDRGLSVCVVSPELHKREDCAVLWAALRPLRDAKGLSLCTDLPEQARDTLGLN